MQLLDTLLTEDVRGRVFENLLIQKMLLMGQFTLATFYLNGKFAGKVQIYVEKIVRFDGYIPPSGHPPNTLLVPYKSNYPAGDAILISKTLCFLIDQRSFHWYKNIPIYNSPME